MGLPRTPLGPVPLSLFTKNLSSDVAQFADVIKLFRMVNCDLSEWAVKCQVRFAVSKFEVMCTGEKKNPNFTYSLMESNLMSDQERDLGVVVDSLMENINSNVQKQ